MKTTLLSLGMVVCAVSISAATRDSADYALITDTIDSGGGHASTANYANTGSLGGVGGMGQVVAPPVTAKGGYIAQLYDVRELSLGADPGSINENEQSQLFASAVLDDHTYVALLSASVAWDVVDGPLLSIDASGLATVGYVYQNSVASLRGTFMSQSGLLDLTVINTSDDDFEDYAGDGIDDDWQVQYYGENNPDAFPGNDSDNDGQDGTFEFMAGTNPTNGLSRFHLAIAQVVGVPDQKHLIFSPRYSSRTYTVEYKTDLMSGMFNPLLGTLVSDDGEERTVTDTAASDPEKYYRVKIEFP